MECCGPEQPCDDWRHACIHPETIAYACGALSRPGILPKHDHDPAELAIARGIAEEAARLAGTLEHHSEGSSPLTPLFVTANRRGAVPNELTPQAIRRFFGDTIFPQAEIVVRPVQRWFDEIATQSRQAILQYPAELREQMREHLEQSSHKWQQNWRPLVDYLQSHRQLHSPAYVQVGQDRMSETNFACVFPRLWVGITDRGSLAGLFAHEVNS